MAKRKLNVRFACILSGSLIALGACTYFVHGYQVSRNAGAMLNQAERAQSDGDLERSADYLNRYLGFAPNDTEALARYGLLLSDSKFAKSARDVFRAKLVLEKALLNDPNRHDLRRRVARMSLELGQFKSAKDDIESLTKVLPNDGELEDMLGRCHEAAGAYPEARKAFERAIQFSPNELDTYARLASLLQHHTQDVLGQGETPATLLERANNLIDKMVQANDRSFRAYLLRADYRRSFFPSDAGTIKIVSSDVARARELAPNESEVLLAAAQLAALSGSSDEARSILRRACELYPLDSRPCCELARLEEGAGQVDVAVGNLREGMKRMPNKIELVWQLADLLTKAGRKDESLDALTMLEKAGVPEADRECLRARLLVHERNWQEAAKILETTIPIIAGRVGSKADNPQARFVQQAGLLLGHCCEQIGDADRALTAYGRVVAKDPRSIPGRIGLASGLASQNRHSEALDQYRQLTRIDGFPKTIWVEIARLSLFRALAQDEASRDWSEVKRALDEADQLNPFPAQAAVLRAEMLLSQKKIPQARSELLAKYPTPNDRPIEIWTSLAVLEDRDGRGNEAMALLKEAEGLGKDSADLRLCRARFITRQERATIGPALLQLAEGIDKLDPEQRRRLLSGLGGFAARTQNNSVARQLWERLASESPNDARCRIALFDLAIQAKDAEAAHRLVESIRKIEGPTGVMWRFAQATSLIEGASKDDKSQLSKARTLLAEVAARRPNWSRVMYYRARADDVEGNYDEALAGYQQAIQAGERHPQAIIRSIELLQERHRAGEINDLLRRLPNPSQLDHETLRSTVDAAFQANDLKSALQFAQTAVDSGSTDFRDYLRLGRAHFALGQVDQAGPVFIRARDLAPQEPGPWIALIQYYSLTSQKEKARTECEAATKKLADGATKLALAECYEVAGMIKEATEHYDAAAAAAPNDPATLRATADFAMRTGRPAVAEPLLRRLLNLDQNSVHSSWARQILAFVLTLKGNPSSYQEAIGLLAAAEKNAVRPLEVLGCQRTRAKILAMQGTKASRLDAVQILEKLIEQRQATAEDYFLAAQIHDALNDWPRARRRYLSMLDMPGAETAVRVVQSARRLLQHGDVEAARPLVKKLEDVDPKLFTVIELKARLLHGDGRKSDATALLRDYCAREGSTLIAAANLLAELGDHSAAEEIFRRQVERTRQPADHLALAQYLLRQKRPVEVVEICDRIWAEAPLATVVELGVAALSISRPDSRQFDIIERRISDALQKNAESVDLLAAMAAIRNFQGRYDESMQFYRNVLNRNPRHVTALNNAAWLLALHTKQPNEALDMLRRAAEISGSDDFGLSDTRGVIYLSMHQKGATELAIKDLEAATTDSTSPAVLFHLAQAYEAAGRSNDAGKTWRRAKLLGLSAESLHPLERPAFEQMARLWN